MTEEQFCPVIPIATYQNVDEVIPRANNTQFGLCASIWGAQVDRALGIARQMEAGTVFVNSHGNERQSARAIWRGQTERDRPQSKIEGVLEYMQLQTITTHGES